MTLESPIDMAEFFAAVNSCSGAVFFRTDHGDRLDLKEPLPRFAFFALLKGRDAPLAGQIELEDPEDLAKLRAFLR